jgi:hypothetical protein
VIALVFGGLYFIGRSNPGAMLAFIGLAALYLLGMHIAVAIHAFKNEGLGWAFFCFCVPFVDLYYVYKRSESPFLQTLYGVAIVLNIALRFLDFEAMGDSYEDFPVEDDLPIDEGEMPEETP